MWVVLGITHVMVHINASVWERVIIRKPNMMGMLPSRVFGSFTSSLETSVTTLMPCNLPCSLVLVCAAIKTLDNTVCKFTLV